MIKTNIGKPPKTSGVFSQVTRGHGEGDW
eukprot:COSAG06_NODE_57615_length_279_cov_4.583333_1_plen_28_part_10